MRKLFNKFLTSIAVYFLFSFIFTYVFCVSTPNINAKAAILVDGDSGAIIYNKNMQEKIYPASITKLLTAYLAINSLDLNKAVLVTKTGINIPWDSSRVYLSEGEIISVKDLLYCSLLSSGNDAANMLAETVSGSVSSFVDLMNKTVLEIGCKNTHFTNPHGYHNDNHYTTAFDIMKIAEFVLKNQTLKEICETKQYTVEKTNKYLAPRKLLNTNRLMLNSAESKSSRYYKYDLGGKTGSTSEAGNCILSWAKNGDKTLILGIFNSSSSKGEDKRYTDAIDLFEYRIQ